MSGRWRVRRVAKWAGVVGSCLILTAWGLTVNSVRGPNLSAEYVGSDDCVGVQLGAVVWWDDVNPTAARGWTFLRTSAAQLQSKQLLPWQLRFGLYLPTVVRRPPKPCVVFISLLPFLCLVGVPTAILFWHDRHPPKPGHYRTCGYNLTGNMSGVCSECGTKIGRAG